MKATLTIRSGAVAASVAALLMAAPANAALDVAATSCRATIAKEYQKLMKTATKVISGCHKSRNKGDLTLTGTDCNDVAAADTKGKYAKTVGKSVPSITAACPSSLDTVLTSAATPENNELYISCPVVPCTGVTGLLTTMAEVAACQVCAAAATAGDAAANSIGLPSQAAISASADDQKCAAAIAKGYSKYLLTGLKDETSCQGSADKLGNNDQEACEDLDPKGKVSTALANANAGLDTSCAAANLVTVGGCATDNLTNLKACSTTAWGDGEADGFTGIYELEATGCPTTIRTTIRGHCGLNGNAQGSCLTGRGFESDTVLSVGWKGLAHGVDITDSYTIAGDVSCAGTEAGTCGICNVDGSSIDNVQYLDFLRCKSQPWLLCTNPDSTNMNQDVACQANGGDGICRYFLGPPLSLSSGGTPTCTLNVLNQDVTGTFNPDDGTSALLLDLSAVVHLGIGVTTPCPTCENDLVAQDGLKQGTCAGSSGARFGQSCDVQGFDLSFAQTDVNNPVRGNSLDCPPGSGANISGSGLAITLPLTTGQTSKTAVDPCESPAQALNCFCGVCSTITTLSCNSDADCEAADPGQGSVCGQGGGVGRKPNNCGNGVCNPNPPLTDRGLCNDLLTYCEGATFADGKGIIGCAVDADCDALDASCPNNNCGDCLLVDQLSCFLNPIETNGIPDPVNPVLGGVFCLPPSSNGAVNSATGSPGPASVYTDSLLQYRY